MSISREGKLVLQIARLHSRLLRSLDASLSVHGLSFTEFMVMRHLDAAASKTMRRVDLAENVGLSPSGVTRLLNPMQKRGLVGKEESARDARVSLVRLARAGEDVFREAEASFNACAKQFLKPLESGDRAVLADIVQTLS